MSKWTHFICEPCWNDRNPDREPVRVIKSFDGPDTLQCCFCLTLSENSGIYVRKDPAKTPCCGVGGVHGNE